MSERHLMGKGRLEAFSDGVIAVIITIMVLEMKVPHGTDIEALLPLWPVVLAYVLSYILSQSLIRVHGAKSALARSVGRDFKGMISTAIYVVAIPLAFVQWWLAFALYCVVAAIWIVPDRRIERGAVSK